MPGRADHGNQLRTLRGKGDGANHRQHVEFRHAVLPPGGPERHPRTGSSHDDEQRIRRTRSHRFGRAACDFAGRSHLQCRGQCDWRSSTVPATHSRPRAPRPRAESRCMMRAFDYVTPKTQPQALSLLGKAWGETEIIAGGTDLLALMKDDVLTPKRLVNIKQLPGMQAISRTREGISVGALAILDQLAEAPELRTNYPALAEAINEAASPQIRNLATLGGNLCQRPRCWYFRRGLGLIPRDQSGKDLVEVGENRYHAILGNDGPAKFISPSTIVPVLIAYGAKIQLAGPKGKRELPLEKFYVIPKTAEEREHDLLPNEIVTGITLPSSRGLKVAHYELRQKAAFDWPLALAAVALKMSGSNVSSARVVMGYVAPVPWVSSEAEQALTGKPVSEEQAKAAADAALKNARPLSQNAYKVQLARVALKRAILKAAGGAA